MLCHPPHTWLGKALAEYMKSAVADIICIVPQYFSHDSTRNTVYRGPPDELPSLRHEDCTCSLSRTSAGPESLCCSCSQIPGLPVLSLSRAESSLAVEPSSVRCACHPRFLNHLDALIGSPLLELSGLLLCCHHGKSNCLGL
jgi:hypothetical protein